MEVMTSERTDRQALWLTILIMLLLAYIVLGGVMLEKEMGKNMKENFSGKYSAGYVKGAYK